MSRPVCRSLMAAAFAVCAIAVASCGSSSKSPTSPDGTGTAITGSEKIGWTQAATSLAEAKSYAYGMYVDGTAVMLASATCASGPSGFECSAPLPPLTTGRHVLELFARDTNGIEGARAGAVIVIVSPS